MEIHSLLSENWHTPFTHVKIELADGTVLQPKGRQLIKNGHRLRLSLPGGGGYGLPEHRVPSAIKKDLESGFITENQAQADYKYLKEPSS